MIKDTLAKLKIALFPKRCLFCGEVICFDDEYCEECLSLDLIEPPLCLKCGHSKSECTCFRDRRETEYSAVVAPYSYRGSVSRGILNMKMNEMPKLANEQGKAVAQAVKRHYADLQFDFVTYIPMYKRDEKDRGFNQSELLAKIVSEECSLPLRTSIVKKHRTKKQKRQNAHERRINMYNAFEIAEGESVEGAKILLIDDVKTTGSTLSSAARTLKAAGASKVYCAVVAIV